MRAVRFLGIGAVPTAVLADLAARVSLRVALPCHVQGHAQIQAVTLDGREQVDADRLLTAVEAGAAEPGVVVAGVTTLDMGNPIFSFFFGRARNGGRALVVSLARLTPRYYGLPDDPAATLRRAALETLHELGHVWGLGHCPDYGCIMRFAPTVDQIDVRGTGFCEACASRLEPGVVRGR